MTGTNYIQEKAPRYEAMTETKVRQLIEESDRTGQLFSEVVAENYEMYTLLCQYAAGLIAAPGVARELLEKIDAQGDSIMTWRKYLEIEHGWVESRST